MEVINIKTYIFNSVLKTICYKRNIDFKILSSIIGVDEYYLNNRKCNKKTLERILTNISLTETEIKLLKYSYYIDNETLPKCIIEYIINNNMLEQIENDYYQKNKILKKNF